MKVKELPDGTTVWKEKRIIGVKGRKLPKRFNECEVEQINSVPPTTKQYKIKIRRVGI